jgi:hypothetical protein
MGKKLGDKPSTRGHWEEHPLNKFRTPQYRPRQNALATECPWELDPPLPPIWVEEDAPQQSRRNRRWQEERLLLIAREDLWPPDGVVPSRTDLPDADLIRVARAAYKKRYSGNVSDNSILRAHGRQAR